MYLLFDIGGTKTRVAISKDKKTVLKYEIFTTPEDFERGVEMIISASNRLLNGEEITAIGGGIGAPLDNEKTGVAISYQNVDKSLSGWAGRSLSSELKNKLQSTVFMENDASIIGLAEASKIEDYKEKLIAYYTISTGVGGSLLTYGRIAPNKFGFEPGNQIIDPTQTLCPGCKKPGRLEDLIGGSYIKQRTGELPEAIDDVEFWDNITDFLAIGLANSAVHWSPDMIILGGSLMNKISIEKLRGLFKEKLTIYPQIPELNVAKLGDLGGLQGAIEYLNSKLEK